MESLSSLCSLQSISDIFVVYNLFFITCVQTQTLSFIILNDNAFLTSFHFVIGDAAIVPTGCDGSECFWFRIFILQLLVPRNMYKWAALCQTLKNDIANVTAFL